MQSLLLEGLEAVDLYQRREECEKSRWFKFPTAQRAQCCQIEPNFRVIQLTECFFVFTNDNSDPRRLSVHAKTCWEQYEGKVGCKITKF